MYIKSCAVRFDIYPLKKIYALKCAFTAHPHRKMRVITDWSLCIWRQSIFQVVYIVYRRCFYLLFWYFFNEQIKANLLTNYIYLIENSTFWITLQFSVFEYPNADVGVNFWEITNTAHDGADKYLTNLLSFC